MNNVSIIFGAPGCGKTTELMNILEKELKVNEPDRIAYVSFTKKGSYEGRNRAMDLFNYTHADLPFFRTLHSIAFRAGEYSKYDLISKKDYKQFSDAMGMKFTGYYTEEFYHNDDRYLFYNFLNRSNPKMAEHLLDDINIKTLKLVTHNYKRFKEHVGIFDFTDIIQEFILRDTPLNVDIAIIDEAQDLTTLQWKMCEVAFRNCKKIYIAGDDDQAIYEWSGADINYFLGIKGKKIILHQSYRMRKNILEHAMKVSARISNRVDKNFKPVDDGGTVHYHNTLEELEISNNNESYYLLSRNNWFLTEYKDYLLKKSLIFNFKGKASYLEKEIKAINTYEQYRKTGKIDERSMMSLRLYLKDNANIKHPWYESLNFDRELIAYYRDLIKNKVKLEKSKIDISTIHGVKGGEADNVIIMMDFTRAVKTNFERNTDSELRCLYVGLTRAKNNLHIIHSTTKNGYDNYIEV